MSKTDCSEFGHVWVESDGEPYVRHNERPKGKVAVMCVQCGTTAEAEAYAANTAKPQTTEP